MNKFYQLGIIFALSSLITFSHQSFSQESVTEDAVDIYSLRDGMPIPETNPASAWNKFQRQQESIAPSYEEQPPLINHLIEGLRIDIQTNQCMEKCHTKLKQPSTSHYEDQDGNLLDELDSRYYFCTSCHVPQTDAQPLKNNSF